MSDRLRKSTKKQVISIILVLTLLLSVILSGCHGQSSEIQNKKFRKFTETLFCQEVASNTVSLHYTLKDPGQYGIQDSPVTFGYFNTDKGTRKISTENTQAALKRFSYRKLSRENRLTYDVLDYYLELSKKESDYLLYEEPMGTVSGVQTQIPVLLSEYQFQSKEDVDAYLELMKTTPDYFNSLIAFEQEKAQKGLFMASYTADTVIEQCQAFMHFVKPPFPVDAAGNGSAGNSAFRQSVHAVPEDAVMLVHIGHIQRGTVRQGQGAPVGRLTAALRVEHRAVQRNAPAAGLFVRLCGKDDALALGAESVLFKIFFCALHGAGTSCSGCSLTI